MRNGMTIHKLSNSHQKGTFTYCDSNPGDSRSQNMWRCCSQIASDYMKFYINPLRLVSAPPPPLVPAPPLVSQARVLIATLVTLTRGIQGCPKITSFDKSSWHPILKTSLYSSLFLPLYTRTFSQHPLPKNALPSSSVINPRILFPFSFVTVFHPSLINANYSCRRIFGTSLLTLFGVSLVL